MVRAVLVGLVATVASVGTAGAATVHGVVFDDRDRDGRQSPGEAGVSGAVVALGIATYVVTDANGEFDLDTSVPGDGIAWVRIPDGYQPGPVWASISAGSGDLQLALHAAAPRSGPLTFVVTSDSHLTAAQPFHADLAAAAQAATALGTPPAFFAITGDVTQGDLDADFDLVQQQLATLGVPYVPVPGNHDWYDSGATWHRRVGPDNYSFDIGMVHFVVWNMSLSDGDIQTYLGAELAHVDPAMTIVALSHAPPAPDTIATLRGLGVDYVLTGHTHTNRVIDHDGMLEMNFEPFLMGGLDFTPAGYRVVTLDAAGKLRSYHRTTIDQPFLQLMSPTTGQCAAPAGDEALAAVELDGGLLQVTATIDGSPTIMGSETGGWTWTVPIPALATGTHTIVISATSASGAHTSQTSSFQVCTRDPPPMPTDSWLQVGGGAAHTNAVTALLAPPLVPRWSQQVGGHILQAAPVIANGMVIETATDLGDDTTGGVVAIDLATGAQLWRTPAHARGGVAVAGSVVIVAEIDGTVLGLDLTSGAILWSAALGDGVRSEATYIDAAPTVDDGAVFIGNEHAFTSIDAATGSQAWVTDPISKPFDFTSDDSMAVGGGLVIGSFARSTGVSAWDRDTGAVVWSVTGEPGAFGVNGSPLVADNLVYIVDSADEVLALDLGTGMTVWKTALQPDLLTGLSDWAFAIAAGPALANHVLVVPTLYGDLVGLDATTGMVKWRHAAMPSPLRTTHYRGSGMAGYEGSPVIANGVVWAADTSGVLVALTLETGDELWRTSLGAPVLASLAVADGWLVAATYDGTVHAWSLPYGAPVSDPLEQTGGGCCDAGSGGRGGLALGAAVSLVLRRRRRAHL